MRVEYSSRALSDVRAIFAYTYGRNPTAARRVKVYIKQAATKLGDMPGKSVTLKQRPGVSRIVLTRYPYALYYATEADTVVILHIRTVPENYQKQRIFKSSFHAALNTFPKVRHFAA